ncbi:hypothetical protein LZ554_003478 [Drepanopeziza brunnea f. sp. 'monogermtubi']|nr:hypothetical protein LZ554_003478 [Drepanopeziza brunnea f. sp. 'monogermtubi']
MRDFARMDSTAPAGSPSTERSVLLSRWSQREAADLAHWATVGSAHWSISSLERTDKLVERDIQISRSPDVWAGDQRSIERARMSESTLE